MSNYGAAIQTAKESNSSPVLEPGIHEVKVTNIEMVDINTAKYKGLAMDIVFTNEDGQLRKRIFEYSYQADKKDSKNVPISADDQFNRYLSVVKHLMNKACATDDIFDKAVATATDFKSFVLAIKSVCEGGEMCIVVSADSNNSSTIAPFTGGVAARIADKKLLRFDPAKQGKKSGPLGAEASGQASENLPF